MVRHNIALATLLFLAWSLGAQPIGQWKYFESADSTGAFAIANGTGDIGTWSTVVRYNSGCGCILIGTDTVLTNVTGGGGSVDFGGELSAANVTYGTGSAGRPAEWLNDSTLTFNSFTAGSVPYIDAGGGLAEDNTKLYYSGGKIGIGTNSVGNAEITATAASGNGVTILSKSTSAAAGLAAERTDGVWGVLQSTLTSAIFLFENNGVFRFAEAAAGANPTDDSFSGATTYLRLEDGKIGVFYDTPRYTLDMTTSTDGVKLPRGTDAERPTANAYVLRGNTTNTKLEVYYDAAWRNLATEDWVTSSGGDGNGIYDGSGSLGGNTTVTASTFTLDVSGAATVGNFTLKGTNSSNGYATGGVNTSSGTGLFGSSLSGTGGNMTSTSGTGLIVSSTSGTAATFAINPTSTNTSVEVLKLSRNTSATAAAGIGARVNIWTEDDGGANQYTAYMDFDLTDVTAGSEDGSFELGIIEAGSTTTQLKVTPSAITFEGSAIYLLGSTGPQIIAGAGSPESAVTAPVGSLYLRTDGGTGTTLYVKESGTGNTGWVAK